MPYPEKLQQKHLNGIMDRLEIPDKDNYGNKLSFTGRVDLLVDYCEKLRDSLQDVTSECMKHSRRGDDEAWSLLNRAKALVKQSTEKGV